MEDSAATDGGRGRSKPPPPTEPNTETKEKHALANKLPLLMLNKAPSTLTSLGSKKMAAAVCFIARGEKKFTTSNPERSNEQRKDGGRKRV